MTSQAQELGNGAETRNSGRESRKFSQGALAVLLLP